MESSRKIFQEKIGDHTDFFKEKKEKIRGEGKLSKEKLEGCTETN